MGRPLPPGLSDQDQLVLSQFLAGHLSAGQLSERLQLSEQRSQGSLERLTDRSHRYRFMQAALGGVIAAIAVAAVGFGIGSKPHVVAAHRADTGRNQMPRGYGSRRVVGNLRATSSPSRSSGVTSGERIAIVGPSTSSAHSVPKAEAPRRKRHRSTAPRPKHARGTAPPAATTPSLTGAGASSTGVGGTTPSGTPPTATTSTSTGPPSARPPSGTKPSGGTTATG